MIYVRAIKRPPLAFITLTVSITIAIGVNIPDSKH
jgi:hypothetical protein